MKGALTARDGAVGTWLRWTPIQALHLRGGKRVLLSLHISISPPLIGSETSARGMTTSSPSPRKRQRGSQACPSAEGPHLPASCPFFSLPPPSQGPAGPHLPHSSVYPVTPNRGSGPLTLSCRIEPTSQFRAWSGMRVERGGRPGQGRGPSL